MISAQIIQGCDGDIAEHFMEGPETVVRIGNLAEAQLVIFTTDPTTAIVVADGKETLHQPIEPDERYQFAVHSLLPKPRQIAFNFMPMVRFGSKWGVDLRNHNLVKSLLSEKVESSGRLASFLLEVRQGNCFRGPLLATYNFLLLENKLFSERLSRFLRVPVGPSSFR